MNSLKIIATQMNDSQRYNDFAPLVKRLAQGEWFTSRASAAGLFAVCYTAFDAQKQEEWRKYVYLTVFCEFPKLKRIVHTCCYTLLACLPNWYMMRLQWSGDQPPKQ